MKFKEYMKRLEKIVREHPKCLEYDVVFSIDEQSGKFGMVEYFPSVGRFKDDKFIPTDNLHEYEIDRSETNSVSVN